MVVGLAVVVALRWWLHASTPTPLNDEISYMRAVNFVIAGESPYTRGLYLYPPLLAVVGAAWVDSLGEASFLYLLRGLCYLGVATTVWISMLSVPWRRWFLPAAIAFLCLAPPVWFGVEIHNISLMVAGSTLLALWIWPRRPILAGALMGVGAVLKPMVFLIPFLLLMHRPAGGGTRHRLAGAVGIGVTALLLALPPYLTEMFSLASKTATIPRSVSFHRLAYLAGWENGALWVSAFFGLAALIVVRRLELGRLEFLVISVTASLMATPVLWSHTLILALPIQAMVLLRLQERRHAGATRSGYETVLVLLAVAAVQFSGGAGSVDDQGSVFQVFSTLPIAVAPLALAAYVMMSGGYPEPRAPAR